MNKKSHREESRLRQFELWKRVRTTSVESFSMLFSIVITFHCSFSHFSFDSSETIANECHQPLAIDGIISVEMELRKTFIFYFVAFVIELSMRKMSLCRSHYSLHCSSWKKYLKGLIFATSKHQCHTICTCNNIYTKHEFQQTPETNYRP